MHLVKHVIAADLLSVTGVVSELTQPTVSLSRRKIDAPRTLWICPSIEHKYCKMMPITSLDLFPGSVSAQVRTTTHIHAMHPLNMNDQNTHTNQNTHASRRILHALKHTQTHTQTHTHTHNTHTHTHTHTHTNKHTQAHKRTCVPTSTVKQNRHTSTPVNPFLGGLVPCYVDKAGPQSSATKGVWLDWVVKETHLRVQVHKPRLAIYYKTSLDW